MMIAAFSLGVLVVIGLVVSGSRSARRKAGRGSSAAENSAWLWAGTQHSKDHASHHHHSASHSGSDGGGSVDGGGGGGVDGGSSGS
jgi:hypothetical protein